MGTRTDSIDILIQYALLVAGEEDEPWSRRLGPIHLIKYVYLADLFFARKNSGTSYTGVEWRFYNFGPWSQTVNARVEPALTAIMANSHSFQSDFGDDDWKRWDITNSQLLRERKNSLPSSITLHLDRDIHKYLQDTPTLLDYVYKTLPMKAAAPNETLDLSLVVSSGEKSDLTKEELRYDSLSNKKKKAFSTKMHSLKAEFQKRKQQRPQSKPLVENPRYDEVFTQGLNTLDSESGEPLSEQKLTANFDKEVWKSEARNADDIP